MSRFSEQRVLASFLSVERPRDAIPGPRAYRPDLPILAGPADATGAYPVLLGSGRVQDVLSRIPDLSLRVHVLPNEPADPDTVRRFDWLPTCTLSETIDAAVILRDAGLPRHLIGPHIGLAQPSDVSRCLAIADRYPPLRRAIAGGHLTLGHATILMGAKLAPADLERHLERLKSRRVSVRKLKQELDGRGQSHDQANPDIERYVDTLNHRLNAPVSIRRTTGNNWHLDITWYSVPTLLGILEQISRTAQLDSPESARPHKLSLSSMSPDDLQAVFGSVDEP